MNSKLKHFPIHWVNGMSFYADQLGDQYLAVLDNIRDAAALHLTSFNYGLLGGDSQKKFSDSFRDNINNEKVEISYCRAITQNGSRIEIVNQIGAELNQPLSELIGSINLDTSVFWYLLLIIDPFTRIPEGVENEQESPRRKPNTRSAFKLELMSLKDLQLDNLANAIPIAKFETMASGLRKINDYIPPCTRINSHEKLVLKYEKYDLYLNKLKEHSEKIINKIKNKRKNREQNHLADDIDVLCEKYLTYFVSYYDEYKLTYKDSPPIKLIEFFARLTRMLSHSIDSGHNRNHMLTYFNQYTTDLNVAQLGKILSNTFETNYVHFDITNALGHIDKFLTTFEEVFQKLVDLDYKELAPRNVVERTTTSYTDNQGARRISSSSISKIKIKNTGREEYLGGDLVD